MFGFDYLKKIVSYLLMRKSRIWQIESQLRDLELWDLEINSRGHIAVDGLDTMDLIEEYGSPLLIINRKRLRKDSEQIQRALDPAPPGSKVLYSYKTNCVPLILKEIHDLGIGAEVISPYELWLAEKLDIPGDMIVYNGVNKTEDSIVRSIRKNILAINIDHIEEIERIYCMAKKLNQKARVGVRLGLMPHTQFGFDIENGEAIAACKQIAALSDFLDLNCIHFHVTSNSKSPHTHKSCALRALEFIRILKRELGLDVSYLDIGGGFGVPTTKNMSNIEYALYRAFGCLPKPPSLAEFYPIDSYLAEVIKAVKESSQNWQHKMPKILIEPGRFITSRSELLLSKVLTVKKKADGTHFAITDAGRLSMTFPCDFEYHEVFVVNRPHSQMTTPYQITGRLCTTADWMFKNRYLTKLRPGDFLAVMDAGAYFSSFSSNFAFPRPSIIMVSDGSSSIIRKQETFEHLTAMDSL